MSKNKWLTVVVEEVYDDYIKVSITFIGKDNYNTIDILDAEARTMKELIELADEECLTLWNNLSLGFL